MRLITKATVAEARQVSRLVSGAVFLLAAAGSCLAQKADIRIVEVQGVVEVSPRGAQTWIQTTTNQQLHAYDRVRTLSRSRAALRWSDASVVPMGPSTEIEIQPAQDSDSQPGLSLFRGIISFFHRDKPGRIRVITQGSTAGIEGTEFVMAVDRGDAGERTTLSVIEGRVVFSDAAGLGTLSLTNGQQALAEQGKAPVRTAGFIANNILQWCFYYPGVLDLKDLPLGHEESQALADSLAAYRSGDLLAALAEYPDDRKPQSAPEAVYRAALFLAVGEVAEAEAGLRSLDAFPPSHNTHQLAGALRTLIAAVRLERETSASAPALATELLAASYYAQSHAAGDESLKEALSLARQATEKSPEFGFAWERLAELEFSFGRTKAARAALETSLHLAPRNAQALALRGFLFAADNKVKDAEASFEEALAVDSALANAWLGRGLCRIHHGKLAEGRADLLVAAALEPQRAVLRSYLGKAWTASGDDALARREFQLARNLDPADPTSWLYSALNHQRQNRFADAIQDLEKSQELNDNRRVFRSSLLLDQDQAVRSANLASVFADAGMKDVSVRESARAVAYDYANFSAHLNLAASFDALRDPTRFNLRYESEWFNEHLLASLLAPPGASPLSQNLSQQEYARLFVADGLGLSSSTEYLSTGEFREVATQFGNFGNTSYAFDVEYQHNNGVRVNNDLDRLEWYTRIKQQVTPQDSLLFLMKYQDYESGDNFQYYDASSARPGFRFEETQKPMLLAGWHHEWAPGVHTLLVGGRLVNDQHLTDTNANQIIAVVNPANTFDPTRVVPFDVDYHSEFETYSVELSQIFQRERHTDILGVRYQDGGFHADNTFEDPPANLAPLFTLPSVSETDADLRRLSLYAYHHWEVVDGLLLIGGLAYDDLEYPSDYRRPSLNSSESNVSQVSPKAGVIWDITPAVRFRTMYAQAVGGVSYDESVRLEPTQLAGFSQSFRSLISESLAGSVEAPQYDILGGAFDLRPWTNAWLSLQGDWLREEVKREFGVFNYNFSGTPPAQPGTADEDLDYDEVNARLVLNQIIGREWFLEAQYWFTHSYLSRTLPDIPASENFDRTSFLEANLHRVGLAATWQHPSGLFARAEFWELLQQIGGSAPQPPGDDFPLLNLFAGYRFPQRRGDLTVGVMNLIGNDYHFNPLNYHAEYPHKRAFYSRLRFSF